MQLGFFTQISPLFFENDNQGLKKSILLVS